MDFFSNLFNTAKNVGSSVVSGIGNIFSGLKSSQGAAMVFPVGEGLSPLGKTTAEMKVGGATNQQIQDRFGNLLQPGVKEYNPATQTSSPVMYPLPQTPVSSPSFATGSFSAIQTRPMSPQTEIYGPPTSLKYAPTEIYGPPTSLKSPTEIYGPPTPTPMAQRMSVAPPPQAPSGTPGVSAQTFGPSQSAGSGGVFSSQGVSGTTGGGSNFTGTLSAVGGVGGVQGQPMTEEEKKRQQAQTEIYGPPISLKTPVQFQGPLPYGATQTQEKTFRTTGISPSLPPFKIAGTTGAINPVEMKTTATAVQGIGSKAKQTASQYDSEHNAKVQQELDKSQKPNNGEPVVPANGEIVKYSPDPATDLAKLQQIPIQTLDATLTKYKVSDTLADITAMQDRIRAETTVYQSDIKDIKDNPDLPAKLKDRRIKRIQDAQDVNIKALVAQYGFLKDTYDLRMGLAKEELGLQKDTRTEQQRQLENQRDNQRMMVAQYISSGAFADFTDKQLKTIADSGLGYDMASLEAMRTAQKTNNDAKIAKAASDLEFKRQSAENATARLELAQQNAGGKAPKGLTGADYNSRIAQEISNVYSGRYGKDGAREKVINVLQSEFPNVDVSKDIYNRIPNGYETNVQSGITSKNLTPDQMSILNDAKAAIDQVKMRYGDVETTRQQIIQQAQQQYGFDLSLYL